MNSSEEKEARDRTAAQDSKMFVEICDKIRKILDQMHQIRKTTSKKNQSKVNEMNNLRSEFSMHFLTLKKLNRLDKYRTKHFRETTQASRQRVDSFHLQLQNLLYEVLHLEKEVTKCLQFKSGDEDVPLIPVDEFYKLAPPNLSKAAETKKNAHLLHLARLEFEIMQRQLQAEKRKGKEEEQEELEIRIDSKKEQLNKLKPQLKAILASTKSLQEYLDMPMDDERDQCENAKYLPHPLFVIYSESKAYAKVFDPNIKVEIKGDLSKAKDVLKAKKIKDNSDNNDQDDDIVMDNDEDDEKAIKKKKRGGNKMSEVVNLSDESKESDKIGKLLAVHPLTVTVLMRLMKSGSDTPIGNIHLTFKYMTHLEVSAVHVKFDVDKEVQVISSLEKEILQPSSIFAHLLDEPDSGESIPNPTYLYRMEKLGLETFPQDEMKKIGIAFSWVQQLSGLIFPQAPELDEDVEVPAPKIDQTISQTKMVRIMGQIRERFLARLALQRQLLLLEKVELMNVEMQIPDELRSIFPPRITSKLRAWTSVDLEQYMALSVCQHLKDGGAVSDRDFFYRLQINREFANPGSGQTTASLIGLVAIMPSYPRDIPVFCLNLHWNGEHNARNSERIRVLESEVNTRFLQMSNDAETNPKSAEKGFHYEILSLQIQHLMASMDVLIDSWNFDQAQQGAAKMDTTRENLYLQHVRGRRRMPPLKYQSDLQLYTH